VRLAETFASLIAFPGDLRPARYTRCVLRALLAGFALVLLFAACDDNDGRAPGVTPPTDEGLPTIRISGKEGPAVTVVVELATTPEERARGLMFREELPEHRGMLFVFPVDHRGNFWMKDTLIPLDIAFIDSSGRVIEIHQREPLDLEGRGPGAPYRYALEVNQGWFERNGLGVGDRVEIPGSITASR
jgi:uncharacterized membrane protein (UPF0127 family)